MSTNLPEPESIKQCFKETETILTSHPQILISHITAKTQ